MDDAISNFSHKEKIFGLLLGAAVSCKTLCVIFISPSIGSKMKRRKNSLFTEKQKKK